MGWKDTAVKLDESVPEWKKAAVPLDVKPQDPGLAQTTLEQTGQGLASGYLPNIQAAAQPVTDRLFGLMSKMGIGPKGGEDVKPAEFTKEDYVKNRDINTARLDAQKKAYPGTALASQLAGGLISGVATVPVFGAAKAATLPGAIARGAGQAGAMGVVQNPGDVAGEISGPQIPERLGMGAFSAVAGGLLGGAGKVAGDQASAVLSRLRPGVKPNAAEITAATKALGGEPTTGMLTSSPIVQKMESSLYQSPQAEGDLVRSSVKKVQDALTSGSRQIESKASQNSAYEIGEQIKKDLTASVQEKYAPIKATYDELGQHTDAIKLDPNRLIAVANNIIGHEDAILQNRAIAKNISDELMGITNVSQLGKLKSAIGSQANQAWRTGDTQQARFLSDISAKLDRLEKGSITRAAIEVQGKDDPALAANLIEDIKGARQGYKGLMEFLQEAAGHAKIKGKVSPQQFLGKLESVPSEQLATRMIQTNNVEAMRSMQKVMPETFEQLRQLEIANLISKSRSGDEVAIPKLIKAYDKYSPEMKEILLGKDGISTIENMKTVYNATPEKIGPSGTPEGLEHMRFGQYISPKYWVEVLGRKAQGAMLEGAGQTVRGQPLTGTGKQMERGAGLIKQLSEAAPGAASLPQNFYEYIKGRP